MQSRRNFLESSSAAVLSPIVPAGSQAAGRDASPGKKRLAVITTEWRYHSHAWHMAERFLAGYPVRGRWHDSPFEVVAAYVDQFPDNDLSRQRSAEFGFTIYPSIAEALRCGGNQLAVDGVLIIGEHGSYEQTEFGQTKYPRYEFFRQTSDVFRQDGRVVPVFNDKHLSWNPVFAQEMYDIARELRIPFAAGSSLPVTWRMPSVDMPLGAKVEEMMCVAMGAPDSYDFHALEVIQCMAERRQGGETGVASVQGLRGPAVWAAQDAGDWSLGGWDPELFAACLCRSQTLAQAETCSHRFPTVSQIRTWVQDPVAYRLEYLDGTRATMLLLNGLVGDFSFAARLTGRTEPLSTLFYLPPVPNVTYSAELMSRAEATFLEGRSPCPIERTLLTTGLVEAGVRSLGSGQTRIETPHLHIAYQPARESTFANF